MKKYSIIFFLTILISSCSSSDDSANSSRNLSINPPDWIQGTWLLEGAAIQSGFRFAADDVCVIVLTNQSCYKEQLRSFEGTGIFLDVQEEITDNTYYIDITMSSSITSNKFEKVSDTEFAG